MPPTGLKITICINCVKKKKQNTTMVPSNTLFIYTRTLPTNEMETMEKNDALLWHVFAINNATKKRFIWLGLVHLSSLISWTRTHKKHNPEHASLQANAVYGPY